MLLTHPSKPLAVVVFGTCLAWPQELPTEVAPPRSPHAAKGVLYEDVTALSRLDQFRHRAGDPHKPYLPETLGSGVALLDYDNDGWLDIYLVNALASPAQLGFRERAVPFRSDE